MAYSVTLRPRGIGILISLLPFVGCGGKAESDANSDGATGGESTVSGGTSPIGAPPPGSIIVVPRGGNGGVPVEGGASTAQGCDTGALWQRVTRAAHVIGYCDVVPVPGPDVPLARFRGAILIDEEGRVIDNTGLMGEEKATWLSELGDQRWPCLAGQSIGYLCTSE